MKHPTLARVAGALGIAGLALFGGCDSRTPTDSAGDAASAQPASHDDAAAQPHASAPAHASPGPLDFTMTTIDGAEKALSDYRGDVILIVNVASQCGHTPQYEGLEAVYRERHDRGFTVLGFPANNFRGQEPGTDAEIREFCQSKYGVTFPMFSKISVSGDDQHPLYSYLSHLPDPLGGDPKWNFTKFLVDRHGEVVARFEPGARPNDDVVLSEIDRLLDQPTE